MAIGGLQRLVAATKFCTRPGGLLWGLPRVGGTKNPDLPRLLALKPDLVFVNEEENRREDAEALEAAGIAVDVSLPKTVEQVPNEIRRWGRLLGEGSEAEAESLATRIERELEVLRREERPAPFPYACWIWKDPWMTVSDDTYVADLLRLAGGVNVYGAEEQRYPAAEPEDSIRRGAKVHLFPSEPYPFRPEKHEAMTAALFGQQVLRLFVGGDDYCWHGARTLDGLRAMRALRKRVRDL